MSTFQDSALGSAAASSIGPLSTTDALTVSVGSLVVVDLKWESGTTTATVDTGASTPLFLAANAILANAIGTSSGKFYWISTVSGTINPRVTLGAARDFREIRAQSFLPPAGYTYVLGNVNAAAGTTGTALSAGTAAATGAGVGVTGLGLNGSRTITPGTNWLEAAEFNTSISAHADYQLISAASTITGDLTLVGGAVEWVIQLALFMEVAAGGSRPPLSQITLNPGGIPTGPSVLALGKAPNYGVVRWQEWEKYPWSAAAAAAIDVASAGVLSITGAAALTSVGTVAAAGAVTITGAAALTAAGTVASAGTLLITGAAAATSTGTLASAGTVVINGAAALTAQGTVVSAGTLVINGATALTGLGSLAAAGTVVINGAANLTAPSVNDIASAGTLVISGAANLSAIGDMAASGALTITGLARLDDGAAVITTLGPMGPIRSMFDASHRRSRKKAIEAESVEYVTEPAPILVPPQKPVEFSLSLGDLLDFQTKLQLSEKRLELIEQQRQDHEAALIALWMMLDD